MYVYMAITKDEYELPIAVADGPTELARLCHVKPSHICHALKAGGKRFIKVWIEEDEKEQQVRGADSLLGGDSNTTKGDLLR